MNRLRFFVIVFCLALSTTETRSTDIGLVPGAPARLGAGFNILQPQAVYPACIAADIECQSGIKGSISCVSPKKQPYQGSEEKFAPDTTFDVRQIKSKYDYFHELNITASLSGNYGVFGGSASFSFHSLDDLDQNSVSWAITAKSNFGSFTLSQPTLAPPYHLLKGIKLLETCGPEYVAEVDRGVLASVLYTFHSESETKLQEISASLSAGIQTGAWGISGSGGLRDFMKSVSSYGQVTVNVFTIGGQGSSSLEKLIRIDPTDLDTVRTVIADYVQAQGIKHSTILGFRTSPFGNLAGQPEIAPDYTDYLAQLERIGEYQQQLVDYQKTLDQHLYHQVDFQNSGINLPGLSAGLTCELSVIRQTAKNCREANAILTSALASANQQALAKRSFRFTARPAAGLMLNSNGKIDQASSLVTRSLARPLASGRTCPERLISADATAGVLSRAARENNIELLDQLGNQACEIYPDSDLLSELQTLRPYPFVFNYSFDDYNSNPIFPGGSDVLYVQLKNASNVSYVQVKDSQKNLVGMESNDSASDPFGFALSFNSSLRGQALTVTVTMASGSSYPIVLDVPKP